MGAISPVGNTVDDLWSNLVAGISGIGPITKFDTTDFKVNIAAEVKNFDVSDLMERADIRHSDIFVQYAIAAAVQAMNDSGVADYIEPERLGVYIGSGIGGIDTFVSQTKAMFEKGPGRVSPFFIPMIIGNMASGMVAMRYNAMGPCLPLVSACATSTHAVGEAYLAIKHGLADAIITGGSEGAVGPMAVAGFSNSMALSMKNDPAQSSIPFDKRRDGFVIGEGAGVLILEEYEHAKKRGATIYAEVSGYGNTCDAYHMTQPHPDALGGTRAIKLAYEQMGSPAGEKVYINAHGTGTPINDKIETLAIKGALGDEAQKAKVSSTKSMTGHMLGAAGAIEAIASIMAIHTGDIPPTIGYEEPDPECDLNLVVNKSEHLSPEYALSISLGFGGHNACVAFKKEG